MAGVVDTLISGIIKSAVDEILKKSRLKSSASKRGRRRTTSSSAKTPASRSRSKKAGPVSGTSGRGGRAVGPAAKQVSKRRTSAARSKAWQRQPR